MRIYQKIICGNGEIKRKYLGGIFKSIQLANYKTYYFCGIKIHARLDIANELIDIRREICAARSECKKYEELSLILAIKEQNSKTFFQFRNILQNKEAVLVASGPSLNKYKPIKNAIHMGVNAVSDYEGIELDYWVAIDFQGIKNNNQEWLTNSSVTKFFGWKCDWKNITKARMKKWHISGAFIEKCKNAYKFYCSQYNRDLSPDIETMPLSCLDASVVFVGINILLHMGAKKIYLVGCDATNDGYFSGKHQDYDYSSPLKDGWKKVKEFRDIFHPDVKIVSINPVGLKGLFEDIYTD